MNGRNISSDNLFSFGLIRSPFARQVGVTVLTQIATLLLSAATAAITARCLGPTGKGQFAIVFMVPTMLQMFLNFGLGSANVYFAGSGRISIQQLSANIMVFSVVGTFIGFLLVFPMSLMGLTRDYLPGVSFGHLLLAMIALPLGILAGNYSTLLQGLRRFYFLNILNFTSALLSLALMGVLLVVLKLGVVGAIAGSLLTQVVILVFTCWCLKRNGAQFRPKWNRAVISQTIRYGLKGYAGNLLQFFNYRFDMFLVNYFLGPVGVGIYGVSVLLAELLWQLPNAVSFVIFPKSANSSKETMNRFTPRVFWTVLTITTVGAVVLALSSRFIILAIFSNAFVDACLPLLVLLPGVVLLGAGKVLANDIAGRGYPHYNSITSGASLFLTVIFDLILIPSLGIVGAALASTISYAFTFVLSVGFYSYVSRRCDIYEYTV